jgi:hypothetical protein
MDIRWQRGNFIKFIAKMKIRVGGNSALDIQSGDEFDYDGSILKYSGLEINQPQLRGAVSSGWVSLADGEESDGVDAVNPNRNIAKAQTINRDLLKVQRTSSAKIVTSHQDEEEVLRVGDRSSGPGSQPKMVTASDNRKTRNLNVKNDAMDDQGAVAIGRVRTSAKLYTDVSKNDAGSKLNELENISGVKADLFEKTVQKEGITIKSNVGSVNRVAPDSDQDGSVVGQVRTATKVSTEGISVRDTSNTSKPVPVVSQTVPEVVKPRDSTISPRLRVARAIYPDFPAGWVFDGKLADRLAAVKDFGPNADFLEALYAAEGDQFRKVLAKEYPDQFGG